jgi:DNA processing protein
MTCRLAFSYNRDVYALPGRIEDTRSQGCNELIRQKIAEPISSIAALSESLGLSLREQLKGNDISLIIDRHYTGRLESENLILIKKIIHFCRSFLGVDNGKYLC